MKFLQSATAFLLLGLAGSALARPTVNAGSLTVRTNGPDAEPMALERRVKKPNPTKPQGLHTDPEFSQLLPHAQATRHGKTGSTGVGAAALASDGTVITGHSQGGGTHAEDDVLAKAKTQGKTLTHILTFGNNRNQPKTQDKIVPPCKGQCQDKLHAAGISALSSSESSLLNKAHGLPTSLVSPPKKGSASNAPAEPESDPESESEDESEGSEFQPGSSPSTD